MSVAGIIAEFNPLHNGHKYLLDCAKSENETVVCVVSGNFVQRGDVAIIPKYRRAEAALLCGADLVAELPVPWSMSTAQNFALGGVSQLIALGVDTLYFGSECGDSTLLEKIAGTLLSEKFNEKLRSNLSSGETFAKIRTDTLREFFGADADVLCNPNDTLAVEYICAAKKLGVHLEYRSIKRIGAGHDSLDSVNKFASSSLIRKAAINNDLEAVSEFMPKESLSIFTNSPIASISRLDVAIMSKLILSTDEVFAGLSDISEGLEKLIIKSIKRSFTFDELCNSVKSKRYTHARIRRILLSAFLGIDSSYFLKEPPYVKVLGMRDCASHLLANTYKPIITQVAQLGKLDDFSKKLFKLENDISDVYALSLDNHKLFKSEVSEKLIKF